MRYAILIILIRKETVRYLLKLSNKGQTDDSLIRMLSEWHKNVSD